MDKFIKYVDNEIKKFEKLDTYNYNGELENFLWELLDMTENRKNELLERFKKNNKSLNKSLKKDYDFHILKREEIIYLFDRFFKNENNVLNLNYYMKELFVKMACHRNCPLYIIISFINFFDFHKDFVSIERIAFNASYNIAVQLQETPNILFKDLVILYNYDCIPHFNIRRSVEIHPSFTMAKMLEDFVNS